MSRGHYRTRLRYKVANFLKRNPGFDRVRWIAQQIGEPVSSVHYQLQRLKEQGLVRQPRQMYVWTAHVYGNRAVEATFLKKARVAEEESANSDNALVDPPRSNAGPGPEAVPATAAVH